MAPSDVLHLAKALNVELWVDDAEERVKFRPNNRANAELRAAISANKESLLTLLRQPGANGRRGPPEAGGSQPESTAQSGDGTHEAVEQNPGAPLKRKRDTFSAPNRLRRFLLHIETGLPDAQLRVYITIAAQTVGFGKTVDSLSIAQIKDGITGRDGTVWSTGTGLHKRTIERAVRNLVARGLIICEHRRDLRYGTVANYYALREDHDIPE